MKAVNWSAESRKMSSFHFLSLVYIFNAGVPTDIHYSTGFEFLTNIATEYFRTSIFIESSELTAIHFGWYLLHTLTPIYYTNKWPIIAIGMIC